MMKNQYNKIICLETNSNMTYSKPIIKTEGIQGINNAKWVIILVLTVCLFDALVLKIHLFYH